MIVSCAFSVGDAKTITALRDRYKGLRLDWRGAPILQSALTDFELDPSPIGLYGVAARISTMTTEKKRFKNRHH